MERNNVYLIPCDDRADKSQVSIDSPSISAIFMAAEGTCPVELWWSRHDLNMCRELATTIYDSGDELVEVLNFLGKCSHNAEELWDYPSHNCTS